MFDACGELVFEQEGLEGAIVVEFGRSESDFHFLVRQDKFHLWLFSPFCRQGRWILERLWVDATRKSQPPCLDKQPASQPPTLPLRVCAKELRSFPCPAENGPFPAIGRRAAHVSLEVLATFSSSAFLLSRECMAPSLEEKTETATSPRPPLPPHVWGLGAVASVAPLILLLLLCFPFKRKKRQLSTRTFKRDLNASDLISVTRLEDRLSPAEKTLEDGELHNSSSLPSHQAERQTNGFAADFEHRNASSLKEMSAVSPNHQTLEKAGKPDPHHLGASGPSGASCPKATSPSSLQFRKLPVTPKEARVSGAEPLNGSIDNQVYESIEDGEGALYTRDRSEGRKGSGLPIISSTGCAAAPESRRRDTRTIGSSGVPIQPPTALQGSESLGQVPGPTPEGAAPIQTSYDMEKRLSAMYAKVVKRPRPAQEWQPANHRKPPEQEEEEPPPIPEKRFENIYETLNLDAEVQVGCLEGSGPLHPRGRLQGSLACRAVSP
ncbi:uncharacterized protein LOC117044676 [Lacerta agilis]|uniref:uncharacterized protein LOC117044676 n=1 Tax=Lacerta agilis TaxID=80427 RepID=UPI0014191BF7|nr:uncharacterized protein LOC117044676 [Lacerta agilis]